MSKANLLHRRDVVASLLKGRKGMVAVGGLGASTNDMAAAGDHDRNFYLWGGMGGAVMMGLGLALAQPDTPVVVITGDGEMLMGMGALATIGLQKPGNLSIVVLDNEAYGETGGQVSHTASTADLTGVIRPAASQIAVTSRRWRRSSPWCQNSDLKSGPRFANVKIDGANISGSADARRHFYRQRIRGSLRFGPLAPILLLHRNRCLDDMVVITHAAHIDPSNDR